MRFGVTGVFLLAGLMPQAALADPEPAAACGTSYERAQELKAAGKLHAAQQELLLCSQASCPEFIVQDCTRWSSEVEAALPSIVVTARSTRGSDVSNATVSVDGTAARLVDGRPIPLDPGKHSVTVSHPDYASSTSEVLVSEGERNRVVHVSLSPLSQATAPASESSGPPTAVYPLGVAALAGLGVFAGFGIAGIVQENDLRDQPCAETNTCSQSDVDSIDTKYLIADIGLGVGIVSAGIAAALWLSHDGNASAEPRDVTALSVDIRADRAGSLATLRGTF